MIETIHEPFTAAFTGRMSSFYSVQTKRNYTFEHPLPRIEKGKAYMMELDLKNNRVRMLPVLA